MTIQEQIERIKRHEHSYQLTGIIGVYDHVLLKEMGELRDTMEKLLAVYEAALEVRNVQPRPITKRDRRFWDAIAAVKDS